MIRRELQVALAVAGKDAMAELRGRHAATAMLFFAGLVLVLFGFALGPDSQRLALAAPGLLWLALVFAGVLAVSRLHVLEAEDGALEQLALYPVARRAIFLGKVVAGAGLMLVLGVVLTVLVGLLFGVDVLAAALPLAITLLLGAVGFAAVGTFYAALTVRLRWREVLLPLLMLPVVAPLLLAAVRASAAALGADPFGELGIWLQLIAVFDVVMLVVAGGTYGQLLEE
jgi:heme exporter protein B